MFQQTLIMAIKLYTKTISIAIISLVISLTTINSCGLYSFTGVSLAPEINTVSVDYFQNMAPLALPTLSSSFTDALQQKYMRQTRLNLVNEDGDIQISGEIRGYDITSVAMTNDNFASTKRLSVRIRVKFENKYQPEKNFDKEFSASEDFPGDQSDVSAQETLIEDIIETLAENIFIATVADW